MTENLATIKSIPKEIPNAPEFLEVRGEVYMPHEAFFALKEQQELEDKKKRCREGIAEAKAKGTKFGRQAIEIDEEQFKKQADRAIARYITHNEAMNILHLKPYVYWKWIKQFYPNYQPNKKKVIKG